MCATCEGCGSAEGMHIRFDDRRGLLSCLAAPRAVLSFPSFLSLPKAQTLVRTTFVATRAGTVHGVAYWWEVQMLPPGGGGGGGGGTNNRNSEEDEAGGGIATSPSMSTAPGRTPLPDHWRQNLIPLQTPLEVAEGQTVELAFSHDADECWVDVRVGGVFSDRPPATGGPARAEVEGGVGSKGDGCRGGGASARAEFTPRSRVFGCSPSTTKTGEPCCEGRWTPSLSRPNQSRTMEAAKGAWESSWCSETDLSRHSLPRLAAFRCWSYPWDPLIRLRNEWRNACAYALRRQGCLTGWFLHH